MRNSWARSPAGTRAAVKTARARVNSHSIIGAIPSSVVLHIVLKKPPPKPKTDTVVKKKRKGTQEDDTSAVDVKPAPKVETDDSKNRS
ncbi:hypothetical protein G6F43_001394 [Rhizopus delemar]|nr:hypothetical protein G6F43_001394 [Rhizopus delemar]